MPVLAQSRALHSKSLPQQNRFVSACKMLLFFVCWATFLRNLHERKNQKLKKNVFLLFIPTNHQLNRLATTIHSDFSPGQKVANQVAGSGQYVLWSCCRSDGHSSEEGVPGNWIAISPVKVKQTQCRVRLCSGSSELFFYVAVIEIGGTVKFREKITLKHSKDHPTSTRM